MKEKVVIWGASIHALVVADIIRVAGTYEIAGFLDDLQPERYGQEFGGARVLGGREQLDELLKRGVHHVFLGLGSNLARLKLAQIVREKGLELAFAIHPSASLASDLVVGGGTLISPFASINPVVRIGENVILQSSVTIGHESTIGDGAQIMTGARVAGQVDVGCAANVGMGAIVAKGVKIGERSIIGAGSVVLRDIPPGVLAYGSPAKVIREIVND